MTIERVFQSWTTFLYQLVSSSSNLFAQSWSKCIWICLRRIRSVSRGACTINFWWKVICFVSQSPFCRLLSSPPPYSLLTTIRCNAARRARAKRAFVSFRRFRTSDWKLSRSCRARGTAAFCERIDCAPRLLAFLATWRPLPVLNLLQKLLRATSNIMQQRRNDRLILKW